MPCSCSVVRQSRRRQPRSRTRSTTAGHAASNLSGSLLCQVFLNPQQPAFEARPGLCILSSANHQSRPHIRWLTTESTDDFQVVFEGRLKCPGTASKASWAQARLLNVRAVDLHFEVDCTASRCQERLIDGLEVRTMQKACD